jgi:hypothetical protein
MIYKRDLPERLNKEMERYGLKERHELLKTAVARIFENVNEKYFVQSQLNTIYELVWECEFKNILNVGRVWLKFIHEQRPFGIPIKKKRSHSRIAPGDIIQISNDFYMVNEVGASQIEIRT